MANSNAAGGWQVVRGGAGAADPVVVVGTENQALDALRAAHRAGVSHGYAMPQGAEEAPWVLDNGTLYHVDGAEVQVG